MSRDDTVELALEPRRIKGNGQAFWQGDYEPQEDQDKPKREKWIWLPVSQIEVSEVDSKGCATVTVPYWLAKKKGLI